MQINHNIRAMVTQHALYQNNGTLGKSLEKLSTGLRVNRSQDDAAGLAMSEQMRTQIRGLGKAKQNAQDGIAALQIAEGGLQEISNLMQRQRELAVQAANDTLTSTERKYLDDEFQELSKEIGRIGLTTDYNGKNLLSNGTLAGDRVLTPSNSFGAATEPGSATEIIPAVPATPGKVTLGNLAASIGNFDHGRGGTAFSIGAESFTWSGPSTGLDAAASAANLEAFMTGLKAAGGILANYDWAVSGSDIIGMAKNPGVLGHNNNNFSISSTSAAYPIKVDFKPGTPYEAPYPVTTSWTGEAQSFTLHVGPNYGTNVGGQWSSQTPVTYNGLNFTGLGTGSDTLKNFIIGRANGNVVDFSKLSITGINSAQINTKGIYDAIDALDGAVKSISAARAKIGTFINRMEYTVNNIANLEYNSQDAESRIRDTDFAKETTNFTKNQIIMQSSSSMLAQANSLQKGVLGLIG